MTKPTGRVPSEVSEAPTVRDLIRESGKSVAAIAAEMGRSPGPIYRWIKRNRVPATNLAKFAVAVGVTPWEVMHFLEGPAKPWGTYQVRTKRRGVLGALVSYQAGGMDLDEVCEETGLSARSVTMVMASWPGERLTLLHDTLEQLAAEQISLDEAAEALDVDKKTVHGLRRRYGYRPGARKAAKQALGPYQLNAVVHGALTLKVIAGRESAVSAARSSGVDLRTLHRHIAQALRPRTLNELAHWTKPWRLALAAEIEKGERKYVETWRARAEESGVSLRKPPYKAPAVKNWREATVPRMIVEVFSGAMNLRDLAKVRGGDPDRIEDLINGVLLPQLGVSYATVMSLSVHHQTAVAEYFCSVLRNQR